MDQQLLTPYHNTAITSLLLLHTTTIAAIHDSALATILKDCLLYW